MQIHGFDHFNIRCRPAEVPALVGFYKDLLGLTEGRRPNFPFPGAWLYADPARPAVLHIAATLPDDAPDPDASLPTGRFDHISFKVSGVDSLCAKLDARGIEYRDTPVPGWPLRQMFFRDPAGVKLEFTYDA